MGLSKGVATELEVVLTSIREKYVTLAAWAATCPGRLHIAGHSMGGGMGAMLAYLANLKSDPLGMSKPGRTVISSPGSHTPAQISPDGAIGPSIGALR